MICGMTRFNIVLTGLALTWMAALTGDALGQVTYELGNQGFEQVDQPDPATPAGKLQVARTALAEGNAKRAIKLLDNWIEFYPYDPLTPEALLLRGDAKVAQREFYKSLFDYEQLLRRFPASPQFQVALERELEVARAFIGGTRRKFLGMRILAAGGEGEELLIRIQERAPGSLIAETSGIELGDYYYSKGEMFLASEMYSIFAENYPNSQWSQRAMQRRVGAYLGLYKGPEFDATGLIEAERYIEDYRDAHPGEAERFGADEIKVRINDQLAQKDLAVARWYQQQGKLVSAQFMFKRVIADYPQTTAAIEARRLLEGVNVAFTPAVEQGAQTPTVDAESGLEPVGRPESDGAPNPLDPSRLPDDTTPGTETDQ